MFNSYNDYFLDDLDMAVEDWSRTMIKDFEDKLSVIIKDKYYLKDMCLSLAYSVYNDNESTFCEDYWITPVHALCYLYKFSDNYKKEAREAYLEHCENACC